MAETASLSPPVATLFLTLAPTSDSRKELQRVIVSLFLWKVTAKVKQGQDIDLRELIPDNAALSIMLLEVGAISAVQAGSIIWEIEDPLTWAFYFWPS